MLQHQLLQRFTYTRSSFLFSSIHGWLRIAALIILKSPGVIMGLVQLLPPFACALGASATLLPVEEQELKPHATSSAPLACPSTLMPLPMGHTTATQSVPVMRRPFSITGGSPGCEYMNCYKASVPQIIVACISPILPDT